MRITTIFLLTVIMLIISALSGNGFSQENQGTTAPMPERFSKFNDPVFGSNVFVFHDNYLSKSKETAECQTLTISRLLLDNIGAARCRSCELVG